MSLLINVELVLLALRLGPFLVVYEGWSVPM